jgi:hypothetical protein
MLKFARLTSSSATRNPGVSEQGKRSAAEKYKQQFGQAPDE